MLLVDYPRDNSSAVGNPTQTEDRACTDMLSSRITRRCTPRPLVIPKTHKPGPPPSEHSEGNQKVANIHVDDDALCE